MLHLIPPLQATKRNNVLQVCSSDLFFKDLCEVRWIFTDCKSNDRSRRHRKLQISALSQINPTLCNCSSFLWNVLLEGLDHLIQQSATTWYCLGCLVLPLEPTQRLLTLSFLGLKGGNVSCLYIAEWREPSLLLEAAVGGLVLTGVLRP